MSMFFAAVADQHRAIVSPFSIYVFCMPNFVVVVAALFVK